MADFLGTRDSNVALSEDNVGRKVLILDTITQFLMVLGILNQQREYLILVEQTLLLIQQTLIQIYNHQDFIDIC